MYVIYVKIFLDSRCNMNDNLINDVPKKRIFLIIILIIFLVLFVVGGTYAVIFGYGGALGILNGDYNYNTVCFDVEYDGGEALVGKLFPSGGPGGGMVGSLSLGMSDRCNIEGIGNISLIVSENSDRNGILTQKVAAHCELPSTLETLTSYNDSSSCTSNGGIWVENGTALKYAFYIDNDSEPTSVGYIDGVGRTIDLYSDFRVTTTKQYTISVWLDGNLSDNSYMNISFSAQIEPTIFQVVNSDSFEPPTIDSGMIPVTIANDGTVKTILKNDSNWYDYENKKWANAVLVDESLRDNYLNTSGKVIPESAILAYYVWIPRYKYKIWTIDSSTATLPQTIDIVFEKKSDPLSLGSSVGEYRTHPAFTFGDELISGFWVGKFETTGTIEEPTIKPNVSSLKSQALNVMFNTSLSFSGGVMDTTSGAVTFSGNSFYGLTSKSDSHILKNIDWGAVAYLSHSKYGINEEVRINNYFNESLTLTGCGATLHMSEEVSTTCGISYGSPSTEINTYPQSTTGNITGVFDMSGGTHDFVMANFNNTVGSSGFTVMPESKYYDLYTNSSYLIACNSGLCYGDATFETSGWYSDTLGTNLSTEYPWVGRGGVYDEISGAGIFRLGRCGGGAVDTRGVRFMLIVQD